MVKVVFGCMTFGQEGKEQARVYSLKDCQAILDVFKKHGHVELDTARCVPSGGPDRDRYAFS
jgi:aflatoxin B1 aldehyde reductase